MAACLGRLARKLRIGDHITVRLILLQSQYYGSDIAMHNIKKIELNLLVVLDALLDERNVTRAAVRLGYTQPTISGMLTRCATSLAIRCSYGRNAAC